MIPATDPSGILYVWRQPYKAPQNAIGLFTWEEASALLGWSVGTIRAMIREGGGKFNTRLYHVELDQ